MTYPETAQVAKLKNFYELDGTIVEVCEKDEYFTTFVLDPHNSDYEPGDMILVMARELEPLNDATKDLIEALS